MTTVGTLLRHYRTAESRNHGRGDYSQLKVAERAGISVATLRRYERDEVDKPQQDVLAVLGMALQLDSDEMQALLIAAGILRFKAFSKPTVDLEPIQQKVVAAKLAGDDKAHAVALAELGHAYRKNGDLDQAEAMFKESFEINQRIENPEGICATMAFLGMLYLEKGDATQARSHLQAAQQGFSALGFLKQAQQIEQVLVAKGWQAQASVSPPNVIEMTVKMVKAARGGDASAQQPARKACESLVRTGNPQLKTLGKGLLEILDGADPALALAAVPGELRTQVLVALA